MTVESQPDTMQELFCDAYHKRKQDTPKEPHPTWRTP